MRFIPINEQTSLDQLGDIYMSSAIVQVLSPDSKRGFYVFDSHWEACMFEDIIRYNLGGRTNSIFNI